MLKISASQRIWYLAGGLFVTIFSLALVAFWEVIEATWLRIQFRGRYECFEYWSDCVDDKFTIHVYLPSGYTPVQAYPAIFVLDGDSDGKPMAGIIAQQRLEAIVIGIGYGSDDADARERDYTPFDAPEIDWAPSGGGEAFYKFLVSELLPEINARYRILGADHRVLAGHSLAGLATLYGFLSSNSEQPTFQGYITASPTLPLADKGIFAIERNSSHERTDMSGVMYLSVGGLEGQEMKQSLNQMALILQKHAYPSLYLQTSVRFGRGHGGNNWRSYIDGIQLMHLHGIV